MVNFPRGFHGIYRRDQAGDDAQPWILHHAFMFDWDAKKQLKRAAKAHRKAEFCLRFIPESTPIPQVVPPGEALPGEPVEVG